MSVRSRKGWHVVLLLVALAGALPGCGGDDDAQPASTAPLEQALAQLPDRTALKRRILFGDVVRLRAAYPEQAGFRGALDGVWLPDALVGAPQPLWRRSFGFGLENVERYVAGGFHPAQVAVAEGNFRPAAVRLELWRRGYVSQGGLLARGDEGSLDPSTEAGRLALGSLNRVIVRSDELIAASTTALARSAIDPETTLAEDEDLVLAARALGHTTSAVIQPAELVRPAIGVVVVPIANERARIVAVGIDDRGPEERRLTIALVYRGREQAAAEAEAFGELAASSLPGRSETFGDLLGDLQVRVESERVVVIRARLPAPAGAGLWRGLLESGDLAVLVRKA